VSGFRGRLYGITEEAPIRSGLQDNSPSSHPEKLLFRIWAVIFLVEDGGPLTDNVVFTAISGSSFLSEQRL